MASIPTKTVNTHSLNSNFSNNQALDYSKSIRVHLKPLKCTNLQQQQQQQDRGIECESCSGIGWLVCDLCKGQKTNVKAENNKIYRRCPSCRATGSILCSKCKVYKCVTFPDYNDGDELNF